MYVFILIIYGLRARRGRDRLVVRLTTTYVISEYHSQSCEFEPRSWRCVFDTTLCNTVYLWPATDLWISPRIPVSSTSKIDRHDITEILLKVALNTINQTMMCKGGITVELWLCAINYQSILRSCWSSYNVLQVLAKWKESAILKKWDNFTMNWFYWNE